MINSGKNKFIKYSTGMIIGKIQNSLQQWSELKKHADEKNIIFFYSLVSKL